MSGGLAFLPQGQVPAANAEAAYQTILNVSGCHHAHASASVSVTASRDGGGASGVACLQALSPDALVDVWLRSNDMWMEAEPPATIEPHRPCSLPRAHHPYPPPQTQKPSLGRQGRGMLRLEPTVDGVELTQQAYAAFAAGHVPPGVPFVAGATHEDLGPGTCHDLT
jgi:hypothetical protein